MEGAARKETSIVLVMLMAAAAHMTERSGGPRDEPSGALLVLASMAAIGIALAICIGLQALALILLDIPF